MSLQRPLTDAENAELVRLNKAVETALEMRRIWLDAKMVETSRLQIGDDIYDIHTGVKLGEVYLLYRFWRDRDGGVRDTHVSCDYQYRTSGRGFDNTSRQSGRWFGTRQDAIEYSEMRTSALRGEL